LVTTLELEELEKAAEALPACAAIIGLGGGQALDVAKFFAWRRGLPLFQVPTATTVNAPFGHRSGVRDRGRVQYLGWAIPEAVYIDFDVVGSAPPGLNQSGVGDILCYHTARRDWELADRLGRTEPKWPFDPALVADAATVMGSVIDALDEIHDGTAAGRGRAFRLLQPRADHGTPLHPRPAGRAGDRRGICAPGQRARADGCGAGPGRRRHPSRGHGRDLGRRR
ncbi:MAG: iron-containing alcohol dehydrogenase family protein, partial [Candidatus Eisenbacteria bacterium]